MGERASARSPVATLVGEPVRTQAAPRPTRARSARSSSEEARTRAGARPDPGADDPEHEDPDARRQPRVPYPTGLPTPAYKRLLDVLCTGNALLVLAPAMALIALLVKLEDGGPVFFSQRRVGKGGRTFPFLKFRSMCVDAEDRRAELLAQLDGIRFKMKDDPRITRVGRLLRRFSLDELPQLLNVLRGDMTLVGPRPPIPEEVAQYDRRAMRRLEVEQGLTCFWQVSGRALIPFEEQVELDIQYIERRSLALDLSLLLRTIPAVLSGRGAY